MSEAGDSADAAPQRGYEVIHGYLKTLDSSPGVYRMLDDQSRVLYVGKARNLKARVSSYSRPSAQHSRRIARMISETASMMFLTTRTETEALLLEQNLIKQLKPKFNVLLRDDKSFPNIMVTDHAFPQIRKHRGAKTEKGAYYGPFASAGAVNRTLNQLQKVFLLRNCSDSMFEGRTRPCLTLPVSSAARRPAWAMSRPRITRPRCGMRSASCRASRPPCRRRWRRR